MKIYYCSDLHLEMVRNFNHIMDNKLFPEGGDVLLLAGDISYLGKDYHKEYFDIVSQRFKQVYWIAGNHEFYGNYDLQVFEKPVEEKILPNITLYNNKTVKMGDVEFFFTTLWSKLNEEKVGYIKGHMADFFKIYHGNKLIDAPEFNYHHDLSLAFLDASLKKSTARVKIVVTHHVPTLLCNAPEFDGSWINSAFTCNLDERLLNWDVDYWLYGHSHRNIRNKTLGKTTFLSNQLGYVAMDEGKDFTKDCFIEV